jgi:glycine hydroxymethyltransferase
MNPADAGFTSYVKTWKPFFVGKTAYQDYEVKRDLALARFQVPQKGLRAPQVNDPITDARGRVIGVVTSCAVMPDGLPIGLAWLKESAAGEGAEVLIFAHASSMKADKHPADLRLGEKASVPQVAKILSRFPKKKK